MCYICNAKLKYELLPGHLTSVHNLSSICCPICNETYRASYFRKHWKTHLQLVKTSNFIETVNEAPEDSIETVKVEQKHEINEIYGNNLYCI